MSALKAVRAHALETFNSWMAATIKARNITVQQFLKDVFGTTEDGRASGGGSGYYQVRNGKVELTDEMATRWANALGIPPEEIIDAYKPVKIGSVKEPRKRKATDLLLAPPDSTPRTPMSAWIGAPRKPVWTMEPEADGTVRLILRLPLAQATALLETLMKGPKP